MTAEIREFLLSDYQAALVLWKRCEGIGLSDADSPCAIERFLQRNPGLSFIALSGGQMLGTVLCGQDGRRGYLYHLAVDPSQRRQGLGKALAHAALDALKNAGIQKCHIMVFCSNEAGKAFWQSCGWKLRVDIDLLSYDVISKEEQTPC